ncbi:MAG: general secretion pathway protein GspB [Gammaproteobacteria bacterium]|nr:general secretion pathway protein GspB [Gammaproteobacteria bacterium]
MSFILDALKRAESLRARQHEALPADAGLGAIAQPATRQKSRWLAVGFISSTAIAVLLALLLGNQSRQQSAVSDLAPSNGTSEVSFPVVTPDQPLAELVDAGKREVRPLAREVAAPEPAPKTRTPGTVVISDQPLDATETVPSGRSGTVVVSQEPLTANDQQPVRILTNVTTENLPSYQELVLNRRVQMPEFHLDIHVYSEFADKRFVFVNNRKYREGQKLDEGGTVERITPGGAVLNHRGYRFTLVPD